MSSGFLWPVTGKITSPFGQRSSPTAGASTNHTGIDIAVPVGTAVKSAIAGIVSIVGYNDAMGNYVTVNHGNGLVTRYQHLQSSTVKKGDTVSRGQTIAKSGNTGVSSGAHLHFSVIKDGKYLNPETYDYAGGGAMGTIDTAMGNVSAAVSGSGVLYLLEKYWYLIAAGLILIGLISKVRD